MQVSNLKARLVAEPLQLLRRLLADPLLSSPGGASGDADRAGELALAAARARGYVELIDPASARHAPELPDHVVLLAVPRAIHFFEQLTQNVRDLGAQWDREEDPDLRDELCMRELQNALDALAVFWSLRGALEKSSTLRDRERLQQQLEQAYSGYESAVREQEELLSTVADSPLIRNLQEVIEAPEVRSRMWFLDLPAVAEGVAQEVEADLALFCTSLRETLAQRPPVPIGGAGTYVTFPPVLLTRRVAASATRAQLWLRWYSPDGCYEACCLFDYPAEDSDEMKLVFFRIVDRQPATELVGYTVRLIGLTGVIDTEAECSFPVGQLRRRLDEGEKFRLEVGPNESQLTEWPPDPEALEQVRQVVEQG